GLKSVVTGIRSASTLGRRWIRFAFFGRSPHSLPVTQPLALVAYEELTPGTQLVNRLQDLQYRVQAVTDATQIGEAAQGSGTMLIFLDLGLKGTNPCSVITSLKQNNQTAHIPIIAFADEGKEELQSAAKQAGAAQVVTDTGVLANLPELIQQALQAE